MPLIHIDSIKVRENRHRQEFEPEAMQELQNSIVQYGLFHAPVLRKEADKWILVAGERRLRAMREIFFLNDKFTYNGEVCAEGMVPFVDIGTLSPLEVEEVELDENLKRKDLTWQEHAAALSRLHNLRVMQKEDAANSYVESMQAQGLELCGSEIRLAAVHTIADTAEEVTGRRDGYYQDSIRKELIVARHLDNPAIAKAKSTDEAFKILKRQEEQRKNQELAAKIGATFSASQHKALNEDCLAWMARPESAERFDVILTDPPYGMGADSFGDGAGRLAGIEHHYDDSYESWKQLMEVWSELSFRVAKPQAHAYVFCDFDRFHELKAFMQLAGWYVFRTPLINHKSNSGRVPLPDQGPRRQYEIVLYAIKGKKPVTHIYPDVFSTTADENMSHGAQKPVAVYQNLLQRSVRPGDVVLDSFAGTGTIFPAAHSFQCEAIGLERNPEYFALCVQRLEKLSSDDEIGLGLEG